MERIFRRDRALVIIALAALSLVSWIYLAILAADMAAGDMSLMGMEQMATMGQAMTQTMSGWTLTTFVLMALMWWIMMVGMMVPSAAPMILLFAMITRKQARDENPGLRIALFTAAYLLIWSAFSVAATLAQWALTEAALVSPMMVGTSRWLTIGLLLACGIYQLTPLSFLMTKWLPGNLGALKMGLSHGAYCVGCCWLLMALLFVGGVMNLLWVALIAILVLGEKVMPRGDLAGKAGGIAMIALAAYMILPDGLFG